MFALASCFLPHRQKLQAVVAMLSRLSSLAARPVSRVALGVAASAACGAAAAATCDNSVLHLKYFDARGVVETSRILLARRHT